MDEIARAYSQVAPQYIELFGRTSEVHVDDLELISRHLTGRTGPVLDLGCGPGHLTAHLQSLGAEAMGLDLVPEFIAHASATWPDVPFGVGSMRQLPIADHAVIGAVAWYSMIHLPPDDLDGVLIELRRVLATGGTLVVGFFDGPDVAAFEHQVSTAYYWPADELAARMRRAGFTEIERLQRPGIHRPGQRPHGAIAAVAD